MPTLEIEVPQEFIEFVHETPMTEQTPKEFAETAVATRLQALQNTQAKLQGIMEAYDCTLSEALDRLEAEKKLDALETLDQGQPVEKQEGR